MTSRIFIAEKPVANINQSLTQHLYLVYDTDGNPHTLDDQYIFRGGPEPDQTTPEDDSAGLGTIHIQYDRLIQNSNDTPGNNLTSQQIIDVVNNRNYTVTAEGTEADHLRSAFIDYSQSLAISQHPDGRSWNSGIDYGSANSNSYALSALNYAGLNPAMRASLREIAGYVPNDKDFSLPLKRYRHCHNVLPFGITTRLRPFPSDSL